IANSWENWGGTDRPGHQWDRHHAWIDERDLMAITLQAFLIDADFPEPGVPDNMVAGAPAPALSTTSDGQFGGNLAAMDISPATTPPVAVRAIATASDWRRRPVSLIAGATSVQFGDIKINSTESSDHQRMVDVTIAGDIVGGEGKAVVAAVVVDRGRLADGRPDIALIGVSRAVIASDIHNFRLEGLKLSFKDDPDLFASGVVKLQLVVGGIVQGET